MIVPFADLKLQYFSIKQEIDNAMDNVLKDSAFIGGKYVKSFETNFAKYTGAKHCIGVGNGTEALFIALKCIGIRAGDEVITAVNSFIATSEAITLTGSRVVFADCDIGTYNINVSILEKVITKKTKAIIPVHLYGQPADMVPIIEFAKKHKLYIIEDAAQAHGAKYRDRIIGAIGDLTCFSFYPGKNLGAYGDAGAIVTNSDEYAKIARMYADHGRIDKYDHEFEGINSRLDGLQAAILDVKLKYLDKWTERRRRIAKMYDEGLKDILVTPYVLPDVRHVYHLYVVRVKNRDRIRESLLEQGISTGIHYPTPLPFLRAYNYLSYTPDNFPIVCSVKDEILSLPIFAEMTDEQVRYVIENLKKLCKK